RPDGIINYYRAMAALDGLKVGLGYEFVDADWVLDFSADEDATKAQPWMVAQPSGALPGNGPLPRPPRGVVPPASPPRPGDLAEESSSSGLPRPGAVLGSLAGSNSKGAGAGAASGGSSDGAAGTGLGSRATRVGTVSLGLPTYGPSGASPPGGEI